MKGYIYKLYNDDGYFYYGCTNNVQRRFNQHVTCAKKKYTFNKKYHTYLYKMMRYHTIDSFKIQIIFEFEFDIIDDDDIKLYKKLLYKIESVYLSKIRNDPYTLNTACVNKKRYYTI